jgi:hypothetical protein
MVWSFGRREDARHVNAVETLSGGNHFYHALESALSCWGKDVDYRANVFW